MPNHMEIDDILETLSVMESSLAINIAVFNLACEKVKDFELVCHAVGLLEETRKEARKLREALEPDLPE